MLPREHCALVKILYNSCGVRLHLCFVFITCMFCVYVMYVFQLNQRLFNQTKKKKGMPREHFSLQMKSDENRPTITREFFHSATSVGKTVIVRAHLCHSSSYQTLSHISKSMYALYKCHITCHQCVAAFIYTLTHADTDHSASKLETWSVVDTSEVRVYFLFIVHTHTHKFWSVQLFFGLSFMH